MKALIPILIGLLVVGCGKKKGATDTVYTPDEQPNKIAKVDVDESPDVKDKESKNVETQNRKITDEEFDALVRVLSEDNPLEEAKEFLKGAKFTSSKGPGELYKLGVIYSKGVFDVFLMELKDKQPTVVKHLNPGGSASRNLSMEELLKWKNAEAKAAADWLVIAPAIRKDIKKPTGELTKVDLEKVTGLNFTDKKLTEVPKGLEKLTQLTLLFLGDNHLTDVKGLENLTQLGGLWLYGNKLTDVKGLEKLTKLEELNLGGNQLTDVKGLEKLTQLTELALNGNQLVDVKGLEKLTQLTKLYLSKNQLTDVKGLEKLTQLANLNLYNNPDLTKAQIAELQKALPKCEIEHNAKK